MVPCRSYEVPAGCTHVDERAFDPLAELREVTLPEGVRRVGRMAFAKTGLSTVSLPSSVEMVGEKAFYHCARLAQAHLPARCREIGAEAFAFTALARVELPAGLELLGFRSLTSTRRRRRASARGLWAWRRPTGTSTWIPKGACTATTCSWS